MNKMKLCKVCQEEIATSAKVCPHCGAKLKMGLLKKIGIGFGIFIGLCIIISLTSPKDSTTQTASNSSTSSNSSTTSKPTWNTTETDATKNGNIDVAVSLLKTAGDIKKIAQPCDAATVMKTPWNYYGKIIKITGSVAVLQDYPAGSDYSNRLGGKDASDIVISTQDGTTVELLSTISSGSVKVDDTITIYGYPIGFTDVENKLGGKDPHLFLVGNSFDKQ
jgi:hypothetical protein